MFATVSGIGWRSLGDEAVVNPDSAPVRWAFCPECRLAAEILNEWDYVSTSGPVAHVRVWCFSGHMNVLPLEMVCEMRD